MIDLGSQFESAMLPALSSVYHMGHCHGQNPGKMEFLELWIPTNQSKKKKWILAIPDDQVCQFLQGQEIEETKISKYD